MTKNGWKKGIMGLLAMALCWTNLQAQAYKKGFKALDKGDFEAARTTFESLLGKDSERPAAEMGLAKIYSNKEFAEYDLQKAYDYITAGIADVKKLDSGARNKLQDDDKGAMDMGKVQRDIITVAYDLAKKENTSAAYGNFLKIYTQASKSQVDNATKFRDLRGVEEAEKSGKYKTFEDWYRQCHATALKLAPEVAIRGQKGMLEAFIRENGWTSYGEFAGQYPDNIYVKDNTAAQAFVQTALSNKISDYREFLKNYGSSPFAKIAVDSLSVLIVQENRVDEYDFFVRNYPTHPNAPDIWKAFYNAYLEGNGQNSVFKFEQDYPNFPFKDQLEKDKNEARKKSEAPLFEKTRVSRDTRSYMDYIAQFPNSPYFPQLEQPMLEAMRLQRDLVACETWAKLYPQSDSAQAVLNWIFDYYKADGEWTTMDLFVQRYPNFADKAKLNAELTLARLGVETHPELPFDTDRRQMYEDYIQRAAPRSLAFVVLQRYIERDVTAGNYPAALAKVERFAPFFGENHYEIQQLSQLLKTAESAEDLQKKAFPTAINTAKTSEYVPLMSADGNALYFCRYDLMDENIYVSTKKDGVWQTAELVKDISSDRNNEGPMTLSADGNTLISFIEGNLYYSDRTAKGWTSPQPLPDVINSDYWDADATLSADGNALIFISRRPGVSGIHRDKWFVYHGDNFGNCDIFVSVRSENGLWQEPINLGAVVNTPFAERSPFLHYDMKTLYFSSDGHGSLGRMDVYKTERLDDSWTNWSTPVNLGKNVNTAGNDWGYKISTDGSKMYYAAAQKNTSNNDQNLDIFEMNMPAKARPDEVCTISGKISDGSGAPVAAQVVWEDLATGKKIGQLKSNPQTGEFFIVIPEGKNYSYFIQKEGFIPQADNIDLRETHCPMQIEKNIQLVNIQEMADKDIPLTLKNLFFDFNKYEIKSESHPELNRLVENVKLAQQYGLKLEIGGHTDNVGSDKDNLTLSRNRAQAVRNYLIAKGCPADIIRAEGYGEGKPIATNDTDEGRAMNRRVEVKFTR